MSDETVANCGPSSSASVEPSLKRHKPEEEVNNDGIAVIGGKHQSNSHQMNVCPHEDTKDNEFGGFSVDPSLERIRQMHAKFCEDRDWDQFHSPRNLLLALNAEIGELSEVFQWKNECSVGLKDWSAKDRTALEEELSDCLIYLVRLADRCAVDLPSAVAKKLAKNEAKYPIDKAFGSSKKYTEYQ